MHSFYLLVIRGGFFSNYNTDYTSFTINIYSAFISKRRAGYVSSVKDSKFGSDSCIGYKECP
jgi:hypothetical protein